MPVDISVERDLKSLRRGLRALEKEVVPQATVRTLNRVAESAKTASARHIAPQMGSRQAGIKRRIETRRASVRRLWATLVASDRPLHLIEFVVGSKKPTQQPGGKIAAYHRPTKLKTGMGCLPKKRAAGNLRNTVISKSWKFFRRKASPAA